MKKHLTPEDEVAKQFLAELGLAVFDAQGLEYGLVTLFAATAATDPAQAGKDLQALMDTRFQKTMGHLIREATKSLGLPTHVVEALTPALKARNWLAHHFYREFAAAAYDSSLTMGALERIWAARRLFRAASDVVHELVVERLETIGISETEIEKRGKAALEAYIGANADPEQLWKAVLDRSDWYRGDTEEDG
ncbi:MAG: hypothetical protein R6U98_19690 [Pirellulaceae bacterium]